jgi:hypothetical protein
MISFLKFLSEAKHKKIRVFDFDDTLVKKTRSKVKVRNKETGQSVELSSGEFAKFSPEDKHELDFSDFHAVLDPQPLDPADKIARRVSRKKKPVVILTARPKESEPHIRKYLKTRGVKGKNLTILAVGSSDPGAKREALKQHLSGKKVSHVEFMDDHQANVEAVGSLKKEMPNVKFKLRVVKPHK